MPSTASGTAYQQQHQFPYSTTQQQVQNTSYHNQVCMLVLLQQESQKFKCIDVCNDFLNQMQACSLQPCAWFLEVVFVCASVAMCVCVSVSVSVCVSTPRPLITSGMVWCDVGHV